MSDSAELLTPEELAARLKKAVRTIYRMQEDGQIPGRTVRGALRFYWPDVLRAIPAAQAKRRDGSMDYARGAREILELKRLAKWGQGRRG